MKVLIVIQNMKMGGVQRALKSFCEELINAEIVVQLCILENEENGPLILELPKNIEILSIPHWASKVCSIMNTNRKNVISQFGFSGAVVKFCFGLLWKLRFEYFISIFLFRSVYDVINTDVICSYDGMPFLSDAFVRNYNKKAHKIVWLHSDFGVFGINKKYASKLYSSFSKVICVSQNVSKSFLNVCPEFSTNTEVIRNCYSINQIKEKSHESNPFAKNEKFKFLTVCRMDNKSKRIDRLLEAVKYIVMQGEYEFELYLVGDGPDFDNLKQLALNLQINTYCHFEGRNTNPYPYYRNADIFVISSDFEGAPITVDESLICGTPIISTNFSSISEQVQNGYNGLIVEKDAAELGKAMREMMKNMNLLCSLRDNVRSNQIDNAQSINQFCEILEKFSK